MKITLPRSAQNWVSLIGVTIALISFFMIVFLFSITSIFAIRGSYIGLVIYILLPAIMITGLILIPVGMYIRVRRERRQKEEARRGWPRIDLNDRRHRNGFFVFVIGTTIFLFISAIGSYEAFHFTESVAFCGTLCHEVMHPEYTAYQRSPHARVSCVDCHVGSGADWYVRSKLSGVYQIYSVMANAYSKPIETPIENLRPARETCEECHWPQKFYSRKLRQQRHYLTDENNSQWDIQLTMKIGPEYSALGLQEGIHWHINPDVKIEFISTDEDLTSIQWIRYTNRTTGESRIYHDAYDALSDSIIQAETPHVMDCMDCHNRPSHDYKAPNTFINDALLAGHISEELPGIKSLAMEVCDKEYATTDSAVHSIRNRVLSHYEENYPGIDRQKVEAAAEGIIARFTENIFPEMKVRWDAYPNFIGHLEFNGCFRCHNDLHSSEDGSTISMDCNLCHAIVAQGSPEQMEYATVAESMEFKHPVDIGEIWKESMCSDCHTGLSP